MNVFIITRTHGTDIRATSIEHNIFGINYELEDGTCGYVSISDVEAVYEIEGL